MSVKHAAGLACREQSPADGPPVLLVHGYPESSYMWHRALPALAAAGLRSVAPDLAGYGDSESDVMRTPSDGERLVRSYEHEPFPHEGRLGKLGAPALILWGGQDRFASAKMAPRFADELPSSELKVFEDAGHFAWDDEPQQTTAALVGFLVAQLGRSDR